MKSLHITLSLLFVLTTGCDELGVKTTPYIYDTGDTDTTTPLEDFVVTDIDPNFGSPSGGTSVVISGNGFEGDVAVSFGNMDIDITVIDDETILLETPFSPSEGQVDVTVESDLGTTTIDNGFTYTNSAPEDTDTDTQDTQDTQNTNTTGLVGGIVEMSRTLHFCPTCFDPPAVQHNIEATLNIHEPVQGTWLSWLPPVNSCLITLSAPPPLSSTMNLGQVSLTGTGPSGPLSINFIYNGQDGSYTNSNIPTDEYVYNTIYGLESSQLNLNAVLQNPSVFESIEPTGFMDPSGFVQPFSRNNLGVLWSPSGTSDQIIFRLDVYGQSGVNHILCLTTDLGGFILDPALLTNFSSYDLLVLHLYRAQLTGAIHPDNRSIIEAISMSGVIGTGYLIE